MSSLQSTSKEVLVNAPALEQFPVVIDTQEPAANGVPPRGEPIEHPVSLSIWDVFVALQNAAEEQGATEDEADALVLATYFDVQRHIVPGVSASSADS